MSVERMYPDIPMPVSLMIEPIDPRYLAVVSGLMKDHGGRLEMKEAFFPHGTIKRFIWVRHEVVHVAVEREKATTQPDVLPSVPY